MKNQISNVKSLFKFVFWKISVILLVTSCASFGDDPLVGATWIALQDIEYPPRRTTIRIHDGRVVDRGSRRDQFSPYCAIQSTRQRNQPLTIQKGDRFNVNRVTYTTSAVNEVTTVFITNFHVESKETPQVNTFQCRIWRSQAGRHISIEDIKGTMKGLFVLQLPEKEEYAQY